MDLLSLIVAIAVIGLIVWAVTSLVPMPPQFKNIIVVVAVVVVGLWVLGMIAPLPSIRVGR